jgi:hypothetical protein
MSTMLRKKNWSRRAHRTARTRPLRVERLEERRLLAFADFELSSLLPANGGDGSTGFVVDGIRDYGMLGYPDPGRRPLGDVNQDGFVGGGLGGGQVDGAKGTGPRAVDGGMTLVQEAA